jgi:hypothetical protein
LVLGGSCDLADDRKMSQESLNLAATHLLRVALAVVEDKAAHPIRICFLCAVL